MTRVLNGPVDGVLLGDQGSRSVEGSDKVYLLADTNGDGDAADAGERIVFFDGENASGLDVPTGNILNLTQASDGAVYIGDGDTDAVYRLFDLNGDGDANDAGEARLWFSQGGNDAAFTLPTPNGVAEGPDGAIYVVNAGVSSRPQDGIYRTVDLNGDGDAEDAGEASLWLDLSAVVPTSSPFDLSFIGARGYLIDPSGSAEDSIYTFEDTDGSGVIEADEFSTFAEKTSTGAPIDFTAAADGESVVVLEWLDGDDDGHDLVRFSDLDGSGVIDQPNETVTIWNSSQLPGAFETFAAFSVAADGAGRIALTSNDFDAFGDNVYILTDVNGDGDYFDVGETNVLASRAFDEDTLERPRSVSFYEGTVATAHTSVGAGNHLSVFLDAETGTLTATGENVLGQLGQGVAGYDIPAPVAVTLPEGFDGAITSVSAGLIHAAFLTADGDVYTWGFGNSGRLGLGDEDARLVPEKITGVLDDKPVSVIEMGNGASYAITGDGALYAWGQNTSGQLGQGDEDERLVPTEVDLPGRVLAVAAGTSHALALTEDGAVYGFGSNIDGQAAPSEQIDGTPVREVLSPVLIEGLPSDLIAVAAATQTSYAVSASGQLYGWGENSFGQLLIGTDNGDNTFMPTEDKILTPVEIDIPGAVIDVKGGARWAVALTEDGDVYAWGPNDRGPTGGLDGDPATETDGTFYPTKIAELDDVEIVEIATGPNHIIAVAADGTVYTWGSGSDGRLGYEVSGTTTTPAVIDFDADARPFLLSSDPADNGRDVDPGTSVLLTFTETIERGTGEIRFVNRDDPSDVLVVDVADPLFVQIDGDVATFTTANYFRPDARYAVEFDEGVFEDTTGQPLPAIAPGDTSTFNFATADTPLPGDTVLRGTEDSDLLRGADGDDTLGGSGGDDFLAGNGGDDRLFGGDGNDRLSGGAGDDLIIAGKGDDGLAGGDGNDQLLGQDGADFISAGAGDDRAFGGIGDDTIFGEDGADVLGGGAGNDMLDGGNGNDIINGGVGNDVISGGNGDDSVNAGTGNDDIEGGDGADVLRGNDGRDEINGGAGADRIAGGAENDRLTGGSGNDLVFGGDGDDVITGGGDDDRLVGGQGADIFHFGTADGRDVITDFEAGVDSIRLADASDYSLSYNTFTGDTTLAYGATTVVLRDTVLTRADISVQPLSVVALTGINAGDNAGISVSTAGDMSGDGTPEVVIGAFSADRYALLSPGEAYVLDGATLGALEPTNGFAAFDLGDLSDGAGVLLQGALNAEFAGWSVADAGDVDGDGRADVIVGAFGANIFAGRAFVVFGDAIEDARATETAIDLGALTPDQGVTLTGSAILDYAGHQVAALGDLDGDGLDDIIIGAGQADGRRGETHVVFGSAIVAESGEDGDGEIALGDLSGGDGVTITGEKAQDLLGFAVSGAGDVDGDGLLDVIAGGWTGSPDGSGAQNGVGAVIFGSAILAARGTGGEIDAGTMTNREGLVIYGPEAGDALGRGLADAGDIDGDGFGDVLFGAYLSDADGIPFGGEAYLLSGAALTAETLPGLDVSVDVSDLSGGRGVRFVGADERDLTGFSVSTAGDVNGGGAPDVLVGAYGLGESGGAYLVFGEALAADFTAEGDGFFHFADMTPDEGIKILGLGEDNTAGWSVADAGDIDGDGRDDILLSSWRGDLGGSDAGEAYLVTGAAVAEAARFDGIIDIADFLPVDAFLFT